MQMTDRDEERIAEGRFGRTVVLLMSLGFFAILACGIAAAIAMLRSQDRYSWVAHTYEVERAVTGTRLAVEEMRSARRGIMLRMGPGMQDNYEAAVAALGNHVAEIRTLTRDNPEQQRNVVEMARRVARFDAMIRRSIGPDADLGPEAEEERQRAAAGVVGVSEKMLAEERRLLAEREGQLQFAIRLFFVVFTAAVIVLVVVAAGSILIIRRYTRELVKSRAALRLLNEDLEGAVRERTIDLQRANDEIQRFAYIVSHDLRSPLVNVLGFTGELEAANKVLGAQVERIESEAPELLSADAKLAAQEDLPEAIGFIRSSTQKMDRLINAILRLSREGRRSITPEPIDMTAMATGVADSLRHRSDELGAEIHVVAPLPELVSDRLAVEQILSNLTENAVKYLKPGRPGRIEIRGRREGLRVLIEVADNGRGIDPRDHDRVFDLFRRSGVQDQPGEGIGLAHVRALAYRIGGTIGVRSALGEGAVFTVNLPVKFNGEQGTLT